jgi:serine/threonine protein kinase
MKPDNLLLDNDFNLKISDFGFANEIFGKNNSGVCKTIYGT